MASQTPGVKQMNRKFNKVNSTATKWEKVQFRKLLLPPQLYKIEKSHDFYLFIWAQIERINRKENKIQSQRGQGPPGEEAKITRFKVGSGTM
jgi:hypothetical protein